MVTQGYKKLNEVQVIDSFTPDASNNLIVENGGKICRIDASSTGTHKEVKYSTLKLLRDRGKLIPGMMYRLIDYTCTVANNTEARAVNHPFDIILTADTESSLSEIARACLHKNDDYYSAENCNANLSAWELRYTLDNDSERFGWADEENGKGVIYWLRDDWGNEAPYDFKQIQFKRYKITNINSDIYQEYLLDTYTHGSVNNYITCDSNDFIWCYTFSITEDYTDIYDFSVRQYGWRDDQNVVKCFKNIIKEDSVASYVQGGQAILTIGLNNIVILNTQNIDYFFEECSNNYFDSCSRITLGNCVDNSFKKSCRSILFGPRTIGNDLENANGIVFTGYNEYNVIKYGENIIFSDGCCGNQIENHNNRTEYTLFGSSCSYNVIQSGSYNIVFGNSCSSNIIGADCRAIVFLDNSNENIIDSDCQFIEFEHGYMEYNHIYPDCKYLTIRAEENTDYSHVCRYIHILSGVKGQSAYSRFVVDDLYVNLNSVYYLGFNSENSFKGLSIMDLAD